MGKQLSLIVGVRDHSEITNLLGSIDEDIEVVLILNNTRSSLRKTIQSLSFDKFTLKIIEISSSSLGTVKNSGRNIFSAILFDIYRFPFLITVLFYQDYKKFGIFSAMYKFIWKFIFTLGYYSQLFFRFLKS